MGNEIIVADNNYAIVEQVVISGDLGKLTPQQRVQYYNKVCESIGLNPFTRPFDYITLNGKLTLYAKKDATEQLRSLRGISITNLQKEFVDDLYIVTATAATRDGRIDQATGAVSVKGLNGEAKANAIMKAETKAKRRVTLSTAGLGWMDESEIDSVQGAQRVYVDSSTGEITGNGTQQPRQPLSTTAPQHRQPPVAPAPAVNGHKPAPQPAVTPSVASLDDVDGSPFGADVVPTDIERQAAAIIAENKLQAPPKAQAWAVSAGYCQNEHEARNSFKKIVDQSFSGKFDTVTMPKVIQAYVVHQLEKQPVVAN